MITPIKKVDIKNEEGTVGYDIDIEINSIVRWIEEFAPFDPKKAEEFIQVQLGLMNFKFESVRSYFRQFEVEIRTSIDMSLDRKDDEIRNLRNQVADLKKINEGLQEELDSFLSEKGFIVE